MRQTERLDEYTLNNHAFEAFAEKGPSANVYLDFLHFGATKTAQKNDAGAGALFKITAPRSYRFLLLIHSRPLIGGLKKKLAKNPRNVLVMTDRYSLSTSFHYLMTFACLTRTAGALLDNPE
jgi:hypothetical protein